MYDFRIRGKFLVWSKQCKRLAYINIPVYHLEPRQSNLSNPEAYSEHCQTSEMECFAKIVND